MRLSATFLATITLASGALAQAKAPAGPADMVTPFLMMGAVLVIMWFFMIRPEQKKAKERQAMISALKKNNKVITSGGMYGTVQNVKENSVMVRIDEGVTAEFAKSAIVQVLGESDAEVKSDAKSEKKG